MDTYIKVEPGCQEFSVEEGDFPVFRLESPAENGRANAELVERIEQITGVRPAIVSGHRSRRKKIRMDIEEEEFLRKVRGEK